MAVPRVEIVCLNRIAAMLIDAGKLYSAAAGLANDHDASRRIVETLSERRQLLRDVNARLDAIGARPRRYGGDGRGFSDRLLLYARTLVDRDTHAALAAVHRMEARLQDQLNRTLDNQRLSPSALAFLNAALNYTLLGAARIEVALDRVEHAARLKA